MFSNLRQGNLVYVINKQDKLSVSIGQLIETNAIDFNKGYLPVNGNTLINITVNIEGVERKFGNLPGGQSVVSYDNGTTILVDNVDIATAEVRNIIKQSQMRLDSKEYDEKIVASGDDALRKLNPQYDKEKKQEEDIANINKRIDDMSDKFDKLINALSKNENEKIK